MYNEVNFIVDVGDAIDENEYQGKKTSILIDSMDDKFLTKTKRSGIVISIPNGEYNIAVGDEVFFHHNVTRQSRIEGELKKSNLHIKDGMYIVPKGLVIGHKKSGKVYMYGENVFVKPIDKQEIRDSGIILSERRIQMIGKITHSNKALREQGVNEGDVVFFDRDSEYRFWIDGQEYYRMKTEDILLKIDEQAKIEGIYNSETDRVKQTLGDGVD